MLDEGKFDPLTADQRRAAEDEMTRREEGLKPSKRKIGTTKSRYRLPSAMLSDSGLH
jgi:hypothetical protein